VPGSPGRWRDWVLRSLLPLGVLTLIASTPWITPAGLIVATGASWWLLRRCS
jgi:hypothetical protein